MSLTKNIIKTNDEIFNYFMKNQDSIKEIIDKVYKTQLDLMEKFLFGML
jgi:hypothetical protein